MTVQPSTRPFGDALRLLMDSQGLTFRALADATRELDGRGLTHAHINMLANGRERPSVRAMELLAETCGVPPTYFAEYRLAQAMRELDPAEVGLEQALANLNARLGAKASGASWGRASAPARTQPNPTGS
jgi:transcriptional regulator with XRE-family HTH domain